MVTLRRGAPPCSLGVESRTKVGSTPLEAGGLTVGVVDRTVSEAQAAPLAFARRRDSR
jgi:hypothetical protein